MGKMAILSMLATILLITADRCGNFFYNLLQPFKNLLQQLYMFHCLANCYLLR